jgi:hypothetical protein
MNTAFGRDLRAYRGPTHTGTGIGFRKDEQQYIFRTEQELSPKTYVNNDDHNV